MTKRYYR